MKAKPIRVGGVFRSWLKGNALFLNYYSVQTRFRKKFQVTDARTERLRSSAIPYMQRLLNKESPPPKKK